MKNLAFLTSGGLLCLIFPGNAQAYLDPGAGSMMVQLIIGAIAATLFTVKIYWSKLKQFFGKKDSTAKDKGNPQE